ncbi:MAG: glycyl-radical enzyme activating protein [Clostridiales bacterium]|jgi:pyruvate formate lyase activating enzyme|nr:glycyl-radical enzyme activating protein [Clostridiales bacterium]
MYLETKGRIFDIQRFSIHDGAGIRTIVFLKGCMLRCKWCCNPESQNFDIETMSVNGSREIIGRDITAREAIEVVAKDRAYYRRSGGGLTLSGGESLCQPEFSLALLKGAKSLGLTTAIESMGGAPFETIEEILPYLDQYLLDIKHIDGGKHKEFTGMGNQLILENARKIAESSKNNKFGLFIRVPVIPGFNSTKEEIMEIAKFAALLPNVKKIYLLPYHRLGQDKYKGLGRAYEMEGAIPPTNEYMLGLKTLVEEEFGLLCQIGG